MATDLAKGMLKRAAKKCSTYENVHFEEADITNLRYEADRFDKVIAGNVIHLLENPKKAIDELERVTKPGGLMIIPTYINQAKNSNGLAIRVLEIIGADFKRQFDLNTYREFFKNLGYETVTYHVIDGRMPCAIAMIRKP